MKQKIARTAGNKKISTPLSFLASFLASLLLVGAVLSGANIALSAVPAGTNLIQNPSAETGTTLPDFWNKGSWGANTTTFTYPVSGIDGARAMRIDMTSRTDGDAKWIFDDVSVQPNTAYVFSDSYKSDVATEADIRYKTANGTVKFAFLGTYPASGANASTKQFSFITPSDAVSLTVFHIIYTNGYVITDNYSLTERASSSELIANGSFETAGAGGNPANWARGGWGANTATFTYPAMGSDGGKAAKVDVSNYSSGDAKWYFDDVAVTAGKIYSFTDSYTSTVPTELLVQYKTGSGFLYQFIASVPISSVWKTQTYNITVPAGATSLTVFHSIATNGALVVDNYSLTENASPPPSDSFSRGMVSLSFDDGWITQYKDALPILNTAGLKGTFYIVSQETLNAVSTERITNPLLETAGTNGDPENWFRGTWGSNTATFTYPVTGTDGGKAAKIDVTNYTDGDAKWYFKETTVLPNENYTLAENYKSNVASIITVKYTYLDNSVQYRNFMSFPSSNGEWVYFSQTIPIPANVDTITAFHLLRGNGSLTVDNYSLKMVPIYVNPAQLLEFQNTGHEIGGHTQTHISLPNVAPATANSEIVGSRNDLFGMGVTTLDTMAYPYGDYTASIETMAKNAGFVAARSVDRGFNTKSTNKYELKIQQMDRATTMADVQKWVTQATTDKTWLILMFHQEDDNPAHDLGVTPAFLQQIVNYVKTANADVVTVAQGVSRMNP